VGGKHDQSPEGTISGASVGCGAGPSKYLDGTRTPAQVHEAVTADVHRAAQLINTGLSSLTALAPELGQ
jgi:hypothetical protein